MNSVIADEDSRVLQDRKKRSSESLRVENGAAAAAASPTGTGTGTEFPPLHDGRRLTTDPMKVAGCSPVWNITPCPRFERLRPSARDDGKGNHTKQRQKQEARRAKELEQRREVLSQDVTMGDYYATLFFPSLPFGSAEPIETTMVSSTLQQQQATQLSIRNVLEDVEKFFIACYYKMNPEALQRKEEAEAQEEGRRNSKRLATRFASLAGEKPDSQNAISQPNESKRVRKQRVPRVPPEGAPATNLSVLSAALAAAADGRGILSRDSFLATFTGAPFEVRDMEALDSFFFLLRLSSTSKESLDGETDRPLEVSCSTYGSPTRSGMHRATPQRFPSSHHTSCNMTLVPFSSTINTSSGVGSGVRHVASASAAGGGNQQITRPAAATPRTSRGAITSPTATSSTESVPPPFLRVREIVAAVDALINGPALREVVRSLCFCVLESDGFIHKEALRKMRVSCRESCEGREAVVTPSIVKALGDALDVMLQEEEQAFMRTQLKGKGRRKGGKMPALLPNQKSLVPLHMMRRSHINANEFSRFFDESPFLAASFAHVWLPAFFATSWPSVKKSQRQRSHMNDTLIGDECDDSSISYGTLDVAQLQRKTWDWEKVVEGPLAAVLSNATQRRNVGRRLVMDRLECMKLVLQSDTEAQ